MSDKGGNRDGGRWVCGKAVAVLDGHRDRFEVQGAAWVDDQGELEAVGAMLVRRARWEGGMGRPYRLFVPRSMLLEVAGGLAEVASSLSQRDGNVPESEGAL